MFFVFGPNGQMVRHAAAQLSPVSGIRHIDRPQALRTRAEDAPPSFQQIWRETRHKAPGTLPEPAAENSHAQAAIQAYAATEQDRRPERRPLQRVADVMSAQPMSVAPDTVVNQAWQQLAERGVAQAPVVNAAGGVIGLLLRADMAPLDLLPEPGAIEQAIALARRPVREVMLSPVPAVSPDTELRRVATALLDTALPGLPVTDESGLLVGFISRSDILKAVAADPPLDLWS